MAEIFEDNDFYTGRLVDNNMLGEAEESLGFRLPRSYIDLLRVRNGGVLKRRCFPTKFRTSWAESHFEIRALLGIGKDLGIDSGSSQGSRGMIREWGYPPIGIVICDMPSGGHDAVMLDYSNCAPDAEPSVSYIDEDRIPRVVAGSFDEFMTTLVRCEELSGDASSG